APDPSSGGADDLSIDALTKDPLGTLTKGFGWFASTVTKKAAEVNSTVIAPTAQRLAEADLAKQLAEAGKKALESGKYSVETVGRFGEPQTAGAGARAGGYTAVRQGGVEPERKDFWDSFGDMSISEKTEAERKNEAVGTSAIKKVGGAGSSSVGGSRSSTPAG